MLPFCVFRHDERGLVFFVCQRLMSTFKLCRFIRRTPRPRGAHGRASQAGGSPAAALGHLVEAPSFPPATSLHRRGRTSRGKRPAPCVCWALVLAPGRAASASPSLRRARNAGLPRRCEHEGTEVFADIRARYAATELRHFRPHRPSRNRTPGQKRAVRVCPRACGERGGSGVASAHPGERNLRACAPPRPPARRTLGRPGHAARRLVELRARLRVIDGARAATADRKSVV